MDKLTHYVVHTPDGHNCPAQLWYTYMCLHSAAPGRSNMCGPLWKDVYLPIQGNDSSGR